MARIPIPKELAKPAADYAKLHREARDKTNEANRAKTTLRNTVKAYWQKEELPIGSFIRMEGHEFRYEATESERIDMDRLLAMYDDEEITREQFLDMVKADSKAVATRLGGDVAADLTIKEVGNKADIRMTALPVENDDDNYIEERSKVRVKRRAVGKGKASGKTSTKRRVKIKR